MTLMHHFAMSANQRVLNIETSYLRWGWLKVSFNDVWVLNPLALTVIDLGSPGQGHLGQNGQFFEIDFSLDEAVKDRQ